MFIFVPVRLARARSGVGAGEQAPRRDGDAEEAGHHRRRGALAEPPVGPHGARHEGRDAQRRDRGEDGSDPGRERDDEADPAGELGEPGFSS